ncbi:MAG: NAD(P)/FAD-dependent oxidoreductase [Elusimicrobia bacterium]|nr:NAD(P)/FAD-dependent oxidoreductase [Elusimicrobiota bacterium]
MSWDCAVIGAGPAGLAAAFYLSRAGRRTVIIESGRVGGRCAGLGLISNHPGFPSGVSGRALAGRLAAQARNHGARVAAGEAEAVRRCRDGFEVRLGARALSARTVIAATGTDFLPLGLPSEARFRGRGLENAPFERAPCWKGRRVAVVGGGETAAHQALRLADAGARVSLVVRGEGLKAVAPLRAALKRHRRVSLLLRTRVTELVGGDRLRAVRLRRSAGESQEAVAALFVLVGQRPRLPVMSPGAPGLFVAGDAAGLPRQTAVAAASGLAQAMAADAYLEDRCTD